MTTIKKHLKILLFHSLCLLTINCTKDNLNCETCQIKKPNEIVNINILRRNLQFEKYSSKGQEISSLNVSYGQKLIDIINANNLYIDGYDTSKFNNENLAGIVVFSNIEADEIPLHDIDRIVFYIRENDGFRTFLFKNNTNKLVFKPEFTFHTNYFASNDIFDLQCISSSEKSSNAYIILNKNLIHPINAEKSDLQLFLNKRRQLTSSISANDCYQPCDSGEGVCIVTGGGNNWDGDWLCSAIVSEIEEEKSCSEKRVSRTINDEINYPIVDILFTSYNFKYSFLEGSTKGDEYIKMYYEISKHMDTKLLNYEFAVQTYGTIKDLLIPICKELMNNSKSQSTLITNEKYETLNQKIDILDTELNNANATQILNVVRNDLNIYKNKTVFHVYNSFKQ